MAVLETLYLQTMRCQAWRKGDGHGRLWEVMEGLEYLIDRLEEWKRLYDEPSEEKKDRTASQIVASQSQLAQVTPPRRRSARRQFLSQPLSQPPTLSSILRFAQSEYMPRERAELLLSSDFDSRGYFRLSVINAWQVLNKYYTKLGDSPLYAAAITLHPGQG